MVPRDGSALFSWDSGCSSGWDWQGAETSQGVCATGRGRSERSLDLPIPSMKWRSGGGRAAGEDPGCSRALGASEC